MALIHDQSSRSDEPEDETRFANFFVHCGREWRDEWSCICDDRCPNCNHEIEPYASREKGDKEPTLLVSAKWRPEQMPVGVLSTQQLAGWPEPGRSGIEG